MSRHFIPCLYLSISIQVLWMLWNVLISSRLIVSSHFIFLDLISYLFHLISFYRYSYSSLFIWAVILYHAFKYQSLSKSYGCYEMSTSHLIWIIIWHIVMTWNLILIDIFFMSLAINFNPSAMDAMEYPQPISYS